MNKENIEIGKTYKYTNPKSGETYNTTITGNCHTLSYLETDEYVGTAHDPGYPGIFLLEELSEIDE